MHVNARCIHCTRGTSSPFICRLKYGSASKLCTVLFKNKKKSIPFNLLCIFIQSVILILQFSGGEKTHAVRSRRDSVSPPPPLLLLSQFAFTQHDVHPLLQLSADISHVLGKRITQKSRWENNRQQTFVRTVVMRRCVWLCFLPRVAIFVCKRLRPLHHYLRPRPPTVLLLFNTVLQTCQPVWCMSTSCTHLCTF